MHYYIHKLLKKIYDPSELITLNSYVVSSPVRYVLRYGGASLNTFVRVFYLDLSDDGRIIL
jgi:hypothetical protein